MIIMNQEKCIQCGMCVHDCFAGHLHLEEGRVVYDGHCMECGHCVAICPCNVFTLNENKKNVNNKGQLDKMDENLLLDCMKLRRSIRQYQDKDVEKEKIIKMIEAAEAAPTAKNLQNIHYLVIHKEMDIFKDKVYQGLKQMMEADKENPMYEMLTSIGNQHEQDSKEDGLFFHAPIVIIAVGGKELDTGLALANMELMAACQGLGCLHSGFIRRTIEASKEIKQYLEINDCVSGVMLVGYPLISYQRSAPRKEKEVTWK